MAGKRTPPIGRLTEGLLGRLQYLRARTVETVSTIGQVQEGLRTEVGLRPKPTYPYPAEAQKEEIKVTIFDIDQTISAAGVGENFAALRLRREVRNLQGLEPLSELNPAIEAALMAVHGRRFLLPGVGYAAMKGFQKLTPGPLTHLVQPGIRYFGLDIIVESVKALKGYTIEESDIIGDQMVESLIKRNLMIRGTILSLLQNSMEGQRILLFSAAVGPAVQAVGRAMGLPREDCMGSMPEMDGNTFSGRLDRIVYGEGKRISALNWFEQNGIPPSRAQMICDNKDHADEALLKEVGRGTIVLGQTGSRPLFQPGVDGPPISFREFSTEGPLTPNEQAILDVLNLQLESLQNIRARFHNFDSLRDHHIQKRVEILQAAVTRVGEEGYPATVVGDLKGLLTEMIELTRLGEKKAKNSDRTERAKEQFDEIINSFKLEPSEKKPALLDPSDPGFARSVISYTRWLNRLRGQISSLRAEIKKSLVASR